MLGKAGRFSFWLFLLLGFALLSLALFRLEFNNYNWLAKDNPIRQAKEYLDQEFQRGEDLVIAIQPSYYYFSPELLDELHRVYEALYEADYVKSINSPLHAQLAIEDQQGTLNLLSYRDALDKGLLRDIEDYRQHLIGSDYWGRLIARDANSFAVIVKMEVDYDGVNHARRRTVTQAAEDILANTRWLTNYQLGGETELMHQLDQRTKENLLRILPPVLILTFLILWLFMRSLVKVGIIMAAALFSLLVTLNVVVYNDHPLNVVSLSLPVLIIVIAVADSIHIVTRWERLAHIKDGWQRLKRTLREMWQPCLITSASTAVGFGTFYFSKLIPLSHFGMDSFIAILLAYPTMLFLTIAFLSFLSPAAEKKKNPYVVVETLLSHFTHWLQKYSLVVVALTVLIAAPIIYQLRYVYTETNFLDAFFLPDSQIYQAFDFIDRELGGSGAVDIIAQGGQAGKFESIDEFNLIRRLVSELEKLTQINFATSYLVPIALVHKEFDKGGDKYPTSQDELAQELLFLEFSRSDTEGDVLSPYLDFDYANTRVHLQTPNLSSVEVKRLLAEGVEPILAQIGFMPTIITGVNYYFQSLSDYVIRTQLESFLLCFLIIGFFFIVRFGALLGMIALITNLLPLGISLGAIALLKLPFDFATVLVASVSLGLCIDDTVHYLHYYAICQKGPANKAKYTRPSLLVPQVSAALARPIFLTSLLLIAGFVSLMFSDLVVLIRFGLFSAVTIAAAVLTIFIFLPCALTLLERLIHRKDQRTVRPVKT